jgi:hypothetical protein
MRFVKVVMNDLYWKKIETHNKQDFLLRSILVQQKKEK